MKLNKKQKRALVAIPFAFIMVVCIFPLFELLTLEHTRESILNSIYTGLAVGFGMAIGELIFIFVALRTKENHNDNQD